MDCKVALNRECCFPRYTKSWWIKLLSQVLEGKIAPIAPPPWIRPCYQQIRVTRIFLKLGVNENNRFPILPMFLDVASSSVKNVDKEHRQLLPWNKTASGWKVNSTMTSSDKSLTAAERTMPGFANKNTSLVLLRSQSAVRSFRTTFHYGANCSM